MILQHEKVITDVWQLALPSDEELKSLVYLSVNDLFYPDRKASKSRGLPRCNKYSTTVY